MIRFEVFDLPQWTLIEEWQTDAVKLEQIPKSGEFFQSPQSWRMYRVLAIISNVSGSEHYAGVDAVVRLETEERYRQREGQTVTIDQINEVMKNKVN